MASADLSSNVDAALLATLPWGVMLLDAQGLIQRLNPQAASWRGALPAALLGQPLAALGLPAVELPDAEAPPLRRRSGCRP